MKLTDEQYEQIGDAVYKDGWPAPTEGVSRGNARLGRAAVAAVAPLVLAEPSAEDIDSAIRDANGGICWAIRRAFAIRLASVTAKPDERVMAVVVAMTKTAHLSSPNDIARAIVEALDAVDAARAPKP